MIRRRCVKVTNHSTNMSEHVALQGAHVPEAALCVTFGAPHVRTHFRRLCTSWPDLWASTPPRQPNDPRTSPSGHLLGNQPPHQWHQHPPLGSFLQHPSLRFAVSSVSGSAMHMERPDDVGREAGIGRTRDRKEPTIFRACP